MSDEERVPMLDLVRIVLLSRGPMTTGEIARHFYGSLPAGREMPRHLSRMRKLGAVRFDGKRWEATCGSVAAT